MDAVAARQELLAVALANVVAVQTRRAIENNSESVLKGASQ
jgi:hypothetical protein